MTLDFNCFLTKFKKEWFFDKDKKDDKILFIDARNVFTQIDRAHREFSPEQISNLAIISKLHKGKRREFVHLIDTYFKKGMEQLSENKTHVEPISKQLLEVLDDKLGKVAVGDLVKQWKELNQLQKKYNGYQASVVGKFVDEKQVDDINKTQHALQENFEPFFDALHQGLKQLDKTVRKQEKAKAQAAKVKGKRATTDRQTRQLKDALEQLHKEVKSAELFFKHIHWLQERFPDAVYEDVSGLCKLTSLKEVKEQDYSLNPGRYVGVVIEEDGKTEEEFISNLSSLNDELSELTKNASILSSVIEHNIQAVTGD